MAETTDRNLHCINCPNGSNSAICKYCNGPHGSNGPNVNNGKYRNSIIPMSVIAVVVFSNRTVWAIAVFIDTIISILTFSDRFHRNNNMAEMWRKRPRTMSECTTEMNDGRTDPATHCSSSIAVQELQEISKT